MLFWKKQDHDYPFRKWLTAELPIMVRGKGDAKLVLSVMEIKAAKGSDYLWCTHATFEQPTQEVSDDKVVEQVAIFVAGGQPAGVPGHFADETAAKAACVNGAKIALLNLINELRL